MTEVEYAMPLFGSLARQVPPMTAVIDSHRADNNGILPHVLLGEFAAMVEAAVTGQDNRSHLPVAQHSLPEVLRLLELAIASPDERLSNLVAVSFLENLESATLSALWPLMAPELRSQSTVFWPGLLPGSDPSTT